MRVTWVVYGSFPTSNHNSKFYLYQHIRLFMGLFLHQTTTAPRAMASATRLFMGLFLHQTTTLRPQGREQPRCLWVFSYIKPQPVTASVFVGYVVYGSFPTSNHNRQSPTERRSYCCLWVFSYIKPQLSSPRVKNSLRCLWVFSYIKPQRPRNHP